MPEIVSPECPPVSWRRNLFFAWFCQFFSMAGFCFGMPFIAYYMQDLGVTDRGVLYIYVGIFGSTAPLTFALMGPMWGSLGDRYGRKLMMLRASVAATLVLFGMGFAANVFQLLAFRFVQGFFTGTMPAAQTLVASHTPDERQGFALGILQTASFSGIMAGGFFGGRCADMYGYAASFKIGGCMMVVSTLMIYFGIQENFTPPEESEEERARPLFRFPPIGPALPILIVVAAVGVARFIDRAVLPLFIQHLNGDTIDGSSTITGDLTAICCLAGILGGFLFGRLVDKYSPAPIGMIALGMGGIMMGLQSVVAGFTMLFVTRFVLAFFMIGMDPAMQSWVSRSTPPERRGAVFGWYTTFRSLGWFFGPLAGSGMAFGLQRLDLPDAGELRWVFFTKALLFACTIPVFCWGGRKMKGLAAEGVCTETQTGTQAT